MVWIHGGEFLLGGAGNHSDGSNLAHKEVIIVTI